MNLVLVKKNHGIRILMEYMKLNNANTKLEIQLFQCIACCLRHQGVAEAFMSYESGHYVLALRDIAHKYFS